MSNEVGRSLPPLRTRLEPFLEDIGSPFTAEDASLDEWRAALKAAGPFRGSERWRAAVHVVSTAPGKMPPSDVADRADRLLQQRRAVKAYVGALAEAHREEVCDFIRATRSSTGEGPLWREVASRFGVDTRADMRLFIWHLRKLGAVKFTHDRGSLDIADPATAAVEAQWPHSKWAQVIREHTARESRARED